MIENRYKTTAWQLAQNRKNEFVIATLSKAIAKHNNSNSNNKYNNNQNNNEHLIDVCNNMPSDIWCVIFVYLSIHFLMVPSL